MALKEILYKNQTYNICYEIKNNNHDKIILFLHGWGCSKEIMQQAFGKYFINYKHIYIDLPGFGNSNINSSICTKDYANIVFLFLKSLHVEPFVVLGHSFGGKVATLLNPKNLVLLSTAGIVEPKTLKIKIKIKIFKLFKNIIPSQMYYIFASNDVSGMSQIMYEVLKNVVNEDFRENFKKITSNTYIFWGRDDKATSLSSAEQISYLIKNSKLKVYDGDHFFFMKNASKISLHVEEFL